MPTTSDETDTSQSAKIIPLPPRPRVNAMQIARTVARLRPRVAAGDPAAMEEALATARSWWRAFDAEVEASGAQSRANRWQ